jgi:hypothetical protein
MSIYNLHGPGTETSFYYVAWVVATSDKLCMYIDI